jgi:hypothetical protein
VEPDDRYYDTGIDRPAGTHPMQLECWWVIKPKLQQRFASGFFGDALTPSDRNTLINSIDPQTCF